jgi:TetR/AcrR family transcriptional repressor of lmrAB and yxaGH operons
MTRRDVRTDMIRGAVDLLAAHGVQGTSFALVLEATDAPRGSIYHHFPGGKAELVEAAVRSVGDSITALLDAVDVDSPAAVVEVFVEGWRALLVGGTYERGCAVAAASLGAGDDDSLRQASNTAFESWRAALARAFARSGVDDHEAVDLAALCIAAVEGALVLGRASRSDAIFDVLRRQLTRLVDA